MRVESIAYPVPSISLLGTNILNPRLPRGIPPGGVTYRQSDSGRFVAALLSAMRICKTHAARIMHGGARAYVSLICAGIRVWLRVSSARPGPIWPHRSPENLIRPSRVMYIRAEVHKDANRRLNFFQSKIRLSRVARTTGRYAAGRSIRLLTSVSSSFLRDNLAKSRIR